MQLAVYSYQSGSSSEISRAEAQIPELREEFLHLEMTNRLLQSLQPAVKGKHSVHCNYAMHHNLYSYVQSKCRLIIINFQFF